MPEPHRTANLEEQVLKWALGTYKWHRMFFIGFNGLLTAVNLYTGKPWWALWPLVITGGLFTLHFLVYKATTIDDAWVDERAADLYDRSYDQGHIDSIATHHDMETSVQRMEREMRERLAKREAARRRRSAKD